MKRLILSVLLLMQIPVTLGQRLETNIQWLLNNLTKSDRIEQATLRVFSPSNTIDISIQYPLENDLDSIGPKPFYTASIGKMFTAVSIAILHERGLLDFDDKISEYLSNETMENLLQVNDHSYGHLITISHLLQHKSGLADYFEDEPFTGEPKLIDQLFINPNKVWKEKEVLQFYKHHLKGKFKPGTSYHYTDTAYLLLGLIIENISKQPLHEFFKTEIFFPLNLNHTYLNFKNSSIYKTGKMMKVMAGEIDISAYKSLSADWAGGGIVSTNTDLITFFKALIDKKLIQSETLSLMQNWTRESMGMQYGFGIRQVNFNELSPSWDNIVIIGHSGVTGAFLYYCSELDTYISGSLNQIYENKKAIGLIYNILYAIKSNK